MKPTASVIACHNGFTWWVHDTKLTIAECEQPGYFDFLEMYFQCGDIITIVAADGTGIRVLGYENNHIITKGLK